MPFFDVYHSSPLSNEQRQSLASSITSLHCAAFTTPSFFVHVRFTAQDASDGNYFMAGKPHTNNSNRIIGIVRTSPARSRADFDTLAARIEDAWYDVVGGPRPSEQGKLDQKADAKRLLMVTFIPMVTIREGGMAIPEAGQEGAWLKSQLPYMREMSEDRGIEDFTDLLKELEEREDLKKALQ